MRKLVRVRSYRVDLRVTPNRAGTIGVVSVRLLKDGRPVNGARVTLTTLMMRMDMGYTGRLPRTAPGRYAHAWPGLMHGGWRLRYDIAPRGGRPFHVNVVDRVS